MWDSDYFRDCVCLIKSTPIVTKEGEKFFLSTRERECILLTSMGKSSKEIGKLLGVSHRTIESHMHNIKNKTNSRHRYTIIDLFYNNFGKHIKL